MRYQKLKDGEILREGDGYLALADGAFVPTAHLGNKVGTHPTVGNYVRPVKSSKLIIYLGQSEDLATAVFTMLDKYGIPHARPTNVFTSIRHNATAIRLNGDDFGYNETDEGYYDTPQWAEYTHIDAATEFGALLVALAGIKSTVIIKLNDKFNATVDHDTETVTVGCQTFPFAKVEELCKAIKF